jgi:hypothetical protein
VNKASRHRRIKKQHRCERLAATSQLLGMGVLKRQTRQPNFILNYPSKAAQKKKKENERERRCCSFEQIYRTMGLISADRSNKAIWC